MIWQGARNRREQAVEGSFHGVTWAGHSHQVLSPGRLWCPSQPIQPPLTPFARRSGPSSTSWAAAQRLWRKARMAGGTTGHSKPSKQTIRFKMLYWTSRETSGQKKHRTGLAPSPLSGSLRPPSDLNNSGNRNNQEHCLAGAHSNMARTNSRGHREEEGETQESCQWLAQGWKARYLLVELGQGGFAGDSVQSLYCTWHYRWERKKGAINERTEAAQKASTWV